MAKSYATELKNFEKRAEDVKDYATYVHNCFSQDSSTATLQMLKEELTETMENFKKSYNSVSAVTEDRKIIKANYFEVMNVYMKCGRLIDEEWNKLKQPISENITPISSVGPAVHLPPCDIPFFSGDYKTWPTFRDMFCALIHNNPRLTDVEKLYYLRQKTTGEANEVIKNIPLTNEGYSIAWKNLSDRYQNKRILLNAQLKALLSLNNVREESGSQIKALQQVINNCISNLDILQINTESWGVLFIYLCSTRLPKISLHLWEQTQIRSQAFPTWDQMNEFLTHRYQTLESIADIQETKSSSQLPTHEIKGNSHGGKRQVFKINVSSKKQTECILCKNNHILRKCPSLLKSFLTFSEHPEAKMLGLNWCASEDYFSFKPEYTPCKNSITKRKMLSDIAKLFDPAGWLAPITIVAKILMQQIWQEKTDWDEPVNPNILTKWLTLVEDYPQIQRIRIPRYVNYHPSFRMELHGFCDASEKAYAATIYIRTENEYGHINSHLLTAKTKVAPIKFLSLPRKELCRAVFVATMINSTQEQLHLKQYPIYFWTDFTIVLAWLQKPTGSWTTFVANRISSILESVGDAPWSHVKSKENPADLATRGLTATELKNSEL